MVENLQIPHSKHHDFKACTRPITCIQTDAANNRIKFFEHCTDFCLAMSHLNRWLTIALQQGA